MTLEPTLGPRVTVERIRGLFGNAGPYYGEIWESQFDLADDQLRLLAQTPWDKLEDQSFWAYFDDLSHVELQPELFSYLFPACLVFAQKRLMAGLSGLGSGDADFMNSLGKGNWIKACREGQTEGTYKVLVDGFLDRLDRQDGFEEIDVPFNVADPVSRYNWIGRLNSLGHVLPPIEPLWSKWWAMESAGQAITVLEYAWTLAAPEEEEDDLDRALVLDSGPDCEPDGNIFFRAWEEPSLEFLRRTLNYEYLTEKVSQAVSALRGAPEEPVAQQVVEQLLRRRSLVEERLPALIHELGQPIGGQRPESPWTQDFG